MAKLLKILRVPLTFILIPLAFLTFAALTGIRHTTETNLASQ